MTLADYRRKRDPKSDARAVRPARSAATQPIFVVQRHDARRLHYDFRLERNGALASWAVPKGVPLEPGDKALAVHVEDHPLEYGEFQGEIPKGQYGGGTVEIWDNGTYELLEEKPNGQLTFELHGKRLQGTWSLVPAHMDGKEQNWLLIKRSDDDGADGTPASSTYRPMLATLAKSVPHGEDWTYEVKFDGFRALAYVRGGECKLALAQRQRPDRPLPRRREGARQGGEEPERRRRRRGLPDRPDGPDELLRAAAGLRPARLLRLRPARARRRAARRPAADRAQGAAAEAARQARHDGRLLGGLRRRRRAVRGRAGAGARGDRSPSAPSSTYKPGKRTRDWLKVKTENNEEFVVAGYTRGAGRRADTFGALVLAVNEGDELRYVGNVGTGFDDAEIDKLLQAAAAAAPRHAAVPGRAEDAARAQGRRAVGRAAARRAGALRRVDARRPSAPPRLPRHPRGQERGRGDARAADRRRDPARASASSGSRTSTSRSGPTRGSPRATCCATTRRSRRVLVPHLQAAAVHDAPLSRRRVRQGVLPEGRADAHARLDPALPRARLDPRQGRARRSGSSSRSSTTSSRCSGWSTWAAST